MLLRCATGMMTGTAGVMGGLAFAGGVAAGLALGAGLAGAAMLARRMYEERQGWREGASSDPLPPMPEPGMDAPAA
jgi:hypothetical protein